MARSGVPRAHAFESLELQPVNPMGPADQTSPAQQRPHNRRGMPSSLSWARRVASGPKGTYSSPHQQ